MKKAFLSFLLLSVVCFSNGQITGVQWQKPFGTSNIENTYPIQKTKDNGIIVFYGSFATAPNSLTLVKINQAGFVEWQKNIPLNLYEYRASLINSNNELYLLGESSRNNHGGSDIWVAKFSSDGNLIWQKSFGGSGNELASSFAEDATGNIVVVGRTSSSNGDVTGGFHGQYDIWVVKLDQNGGILWNRCLGGTYSDFRDQALIKAFNNGYIILSETLSNDGDASGNHGSWDIWVVRLTNSGTIEWETQLGGSEIEGSRDIVEAAFGGYYILGYSYSASVPNSHWSVNGPDLYVAKIGNDGALEWHKCFGGYYDDWPLAIFAEEDGGCVFFANVKVISGNSGDITGLLGNSHEIWSAKIDDTGNIVWQRLLGGNGEDKAGAIMEEKFDDNNVLLPDDQRSYIFIASTTSSTRDVLGLHSSGQNYPDIWLAKMKKSDRTLLWSRCFGGSNVELFGSFIKLNQKEFVIGCHSASADGDVVGHHGPAGTSDAWVVKFGPANIIKGTVFLDMNANGVKDAGEKYYNNAWIKSEKINDTKISITSNGIFKNEADTGTYTSSITSALQYFTNTLPSKQSVFNQYNQKDSFSFPLAPIPDHSDLKVFIVPYNNPRPNLFGEYWLICTNVGSEIISSPILKFIKDARVNWGISAPLANNVTGDTSVWNLSNLAPFDTIIIRLTSIISPPPVLNQGDIIKSILSVTSLQSDETPGDNSDTLFQVLVDSYDPNDKGENHGGKILSTAIQSGAYLNYIVRFQNTGTAAALNIKIRDTLDSKLDWNTLEVITSSNYYELNVEDANKVIFNFPSINLPDSNLNEPASHGFIAYRAKLKSNIVIGDTIPNTASIYFDFNLPVKTNNAFTVVQDNVVLPLKLLSFSGTYHNEQALLHWATADEVDSDNFEIQRSLNAVDFISVSKVLPRHGINTNVLYNFTDNLVNVPSNIYYYRLKMTDRDGKINYSQVLLLHRNNKQENNISIRPNPVIGATNVYLTSSSTSLVEFQVVDLTGRIMFKQKITVFKGNNSIAINNIHNLPAGFYIIQAFNGNDKLITPFIIGK